MILFVKASIYNLTKEI